MEMSLNVIFEATGLGKLKNKMVTLDLHSIPQIH